MILMKFKILLVTFLSFSFSSFAIGTDDEIIESFSKKICVRIEYQNSNKELIISTAFFCFDDHTLITTAHSIKEAPIDKNNPKRRIIKCYTDNNEHFEATIHSGEIFPDRDLAIIRIADKEKYRSKKYIKFEDIVTAPEGKPDFYACGYDAGIPVHERKISLAYYKKNGSFKPLASILNSYQREILRSYKIEKRMIVNEFTGTSIPGYSGAPILFYQNQKMYLFGINEGGLKEINKSWAISSKELLRIYMKKLSAPAINTQKRSKIDNMDFIPFGKNSFLDNLIDKSSPFKNKMAFDVYNIGQPGLKEKVLVLPRIGSLFDDGTGFLSYSLSEYKLFYFSDKNIDYFNNFKDVFLDEAFNGFLYFSPDIKQTIDFKVKSHVIPETDEWEEFSFYNPNNDHCIFLSKKSKTEFFMLCLIKFNTGNIDQQSYLSYAIAYSLNYIFNKN